MSLTVVGVSHRSAPIEVRERFHVGEDGLAETLGRVTSFPGVRECVVLSTCNRTELYLGAESRESGVEAGANTLAARAGLGLPEARAFLFREHGRDAVDHLFRVVAGLDSLVLGEAEIQGQVRNAYRTCRRIAPASVASTLHRLFQTALATGGRVRAGTALGEGAASVPSAAVQLAGKVFGSLSGRRALVIGAGEMGELTLRTLRGRGAEDALITSRTGRRAEEVARETGATAVPFEDLADVVGRVDIVVSSTAAPGPVLARSDLGRWREGSDDSLVVLDIAVPRDVEAGAGELAGVFLYNIDDLHRVVRSTERARVAEREAAEALVEEGVEEFWRWHRARQAVPLIRGIRERAERIRRQEVEEALAAIEGLSEEERERIHRASRLVLNRVLHAPTVELRSVAAETDEIEMLDLARRLFRVQTGADGRQPDVPRDDVRERGMSNGK